MLEGPRVLDPVGAERGASVGVSSAATASATGSTAAEVAPKAVSVSKGAPKSSVLRLASVPTTGVNDCDTFVDREQQG